MLPQQGVVAATVSIITLCITLGFLFFNMHREKKQQASNREDEH